MLKTVSAGLVAVGVLLALPALAQTAPQTDGARSGERAGRLSPEDRQALVDARIAALHTGLKLTSDQEKNWPAVESALRDLARQRAERAAQRSESRERRAERDPIERMRASADAMSARANGLKKLADAAEPLYRGLDDGQKRRLRAMTRYAMGRHFVPNRRH
jgi:hypothetical protein